MTDNTATALPALPEPWSASSTLRCVACGAPYVPRPYPTAAAANPFIGAQPIAPHACKCGSTSWQGTLRVGLSPAQYTADQRRAYGEQCASAVRASAGAVEVPALLKLLEDKSTAAYRQYIETLRRDECLGWEYKVKHGRFGEPELKAHTRAAEHLGMHRAFSAAAADIRAAAPSALTARPEVVRSLLEHADDYAGDYAHWKLESLYGTSKSYTAECEKSAAQAREKLAAALAGALTARPAVALTEEQILDGWVECSDALSSTFSVGGVFQDGVRFAERMHGIPSAPSANERKE